MNLITFCTGGYAIFVFCAEWVGDERRADIMGCVGSFCAPGAAGGSQGGSFYAIDVST